MKRFFVYLGVALAAYAIILRVPALRNLTANPTA